MTTSLTLLAPRQHHPPMPAEGETFHVSLGPEDWDATLKGWRCDALGIANVELAAIYVGGEQQTSDAYQVSDKTLRWRTPSAPAVARAQLRVRATTASKEQLAELETAKNRITELENEKKFSTRQLLVTSLCSILVASIPFLFALRKKSDPPLDVSAIGPCRNSLLRLRSAGTRPALDADDLRSNISAHVAMCLTQLEGIMNSAASGASEEAKP